MNIRRFARTVALTAFASSFASAGYCDWNFQVVDDPFDDHGISLASTLEAGTELGVRCKAGKYELVYVTADRTVDVLTMVGIEAVGGAKLMFRTDKAPPVTVPGKLDVTQDGRLVVLANLETDHVDLIEKMQRTIAVQVKVEDHISNQGKYNAAGSTAAIRKVRATCGPIVSSPLSLSQRVQLTLRLLRPLAPFVPAI